MDKEATQGLNDHLSLVHHGPDIPGLVQVSVRGLVREVNLGEG